MAELEITRDERVMALDGSEMGRVVHVIVDSSTKQLTDLVVEHDGREFLVPVSNVERATNGAITLRATASQMSNAAMFSRDMYHEVDEDAFDATAPSHPTAGTATVRDANEDSVVIDATRPAAAAAPAPRPAQTPRTEQTTTRTEQTTARPAPAPRPAATTRGDETMSVPIIEEKLTAGVREREAGVFRLAKRVVQEQQSIDVPVRREEVYITETNTAPRAATQADLNAMGRDIEVPLREQEVVTSKEAVVTGEVDVRKAAVTETQRVTDTVRREQVHVEGTNDAHIHTQGFTTEQQQRFSRMSQADQERYGRMTEAERAEYDRRNPIEKAVDAVKDATDRR